MSSISDKAINTKRIVCATDAEYSSRCCLLYSVKLDCIQCIRLNHNLMFYASRRLFDIKTKDRVPVHVSLSSFLMSLYEFREVHMVT